MNAIDSAYRDLSTQLAGAVLRDEPLAPKTTYRLGGPAALYVEVASVTDLAVTADIAHHYELPMIVVGRGSNMLVADNGFGGIAISVTPIGGEIELGAITNGRCVVEAGGAVALPVLARRTAAASLTGFEWAVGVPGSIGGAVRMNAGGHGSDMASCLIEIDAFDLARGEDVETIPVEELGLAFRASELAPSQVVLAARLTLTADDREACERTVSEIVRWRRTHQPGGQNCGSVFVNPVPGEVSAGQLIDSLGLRGFSIGSAAVSEKHANFIQGSPAGTAADVRAVIEAVRERVAAETGYRLRSEVRLVGFDDIDPYSFGEAVSA